MKKIAILLLLISSLFSYDAMMIKAKILDKIAFEIAKKDIVSVYIEDEEFKKTKGLIPSLKCASLSDADVLFISKEQTLKRLNNHRYIFATSYSIYKKYPHLILGAFFWQKGRPNIIINEKRAKELGIKFSKAFEKYLE